MTHRPFRGRTARDAGETTPGLLAGPGTRRLFPDVHVDAGATVDLALRARAASLLVPGSVVGGYAAAELLGAGCGPDDADVDLVVGKRRVRSRPGLRVRQDVLLPDEVVDADGVSVTSPLRTAFDLARRLDHVDAVVALDALARRGRFSPSMLLGHRPLDDAPRGVRRLPAVVAEADPRAESPPETRMRLALVAHGVPRPAVQHEAYSDRGLPLGRLDLAWPRRRVAAEYQGEHHRTDRRQYAKDLRRAADLAAAGWLVIPARAFDVFARPDVLAERVLDALADRS